MSRCNDPECGCQPFIHKNRNVEITLQDEKNNQVCKLHQSGATLDVTFDIVDGSLILHETIIDHTKRHTIWKFTVQIRHEHMQFENLTGCPDGSLLLSLRLTPEACAVKGNMMEVKEKVSGFGPCPKTSRLDKNLYRCDWPNKRLEILMPEEKIVAWKTVALIAKTFKRITLPQWSGIVWMDIRAPIADMNWLQVEKRFMARTGAMIKSRETSSTAAPTTIIEKGLPTPPSSPPSPMPEFKEVVTKTPKPQHLQMLESLQKKHNMQKPQKKMIHRIEIKKKKTLVGANCFKKVTFRC